MKKYELVHSDTITIAPGRTATRIRALVAIAALGITPGELGGYVETESNLAQVGGDAWVYGNAWVSGDARVSGNARVSGDARVSG
ncbi:MAG TPA: polymer-forming cytoskeletal protein, partial [Rubrivivax sp.]|nr:polymer-forming cytoskeletal protein [Rubrivivax sp.]